MEAYLKGVALTGLFTEFTGFTLTVLKFVIAVVDLMVSKIGPKSSTNNTSIAIGPIRETLKH